jgi:hypothetical protein
LALQTASSSVVQILSTLMRRAERQNLMMKAIRPGMKHFAQSTKAPPKKFENRCHVLALYFFFHNFRRAHKTPGATPAMAVGVVDRILKMEGCISVIDARQAPKPA